MSGPVLYRTALWAVRTGIGTGIGSSGFPHGPKRSIGRLARFAIGGPAGALSSWSVDIGREALKPVHNETL